MIRFKYLYKNDISFPDTEFIRNVRSHPSTLCQVFHQKKVTRVEQEEWFERVYSQQSDYHIWLAYDEKRSAPFGYIQVTVDSLIHRRVQLYWVPSPEHVASSAYAALIRGSLSERQLCKLEMDIHKVWAYVFPENELLMGILSDNGFEVDATLRDHSLNGGVYRDVCIVSKIVNILM